MENKIDLSNIIIIILWAFQWKSLISLNLASKLKYSWVISTDYIRNFLRINNKNSYINVSTSKMDQEIFEKQIEIISSFLLNYIKFYSNRKEKIILGWIHFSKEFLLFSKNNWAKCFWLNNKISWLNKVKLKTITTPTVKILQNNEEKIKELTIQKNEILQNLNISIKNFRTPLKNKLKLVKNSLDILKKGDLETKRNLIKNIFPKGIYIDEKKQVWAPTFSLIYQSFQVWKEFISDMVELDGLEPTSWEAKKILLLS